MQIALINPPPKQVVQEHEKPNYPSISIGYLYSYLKSKQVNVLAIDAPFEGWGQKEIDEILRKFDPDVIGFSAMTIRIKQAAKSAFHLKKLFPNAIILIGGAHVTVTPAETLRDFPIFDIGIVGEGEITLYELLTNLSGHDLSFHNLKKIRGIVFRLGSQIIQNEPRDFIQNLDSLPFPAYDYIVRKFKYYPIYTSRGCPFQCIFCCRILGNQIRIRSPENVIEELDLAVKKYRTKFVQICDEVFTLPLTRAKEICDLLVLKGLNKKIKWIALSRVTGVDQDLFYKMKNAGCMKVEFGVESGNEMMLKRIKKGIRIFDVKKTINMAKNARLNTTSYFILGHPYETKHSIEETINLATNLNTTEVAIGIMVPYPGTEIYRMALKSEGNYIPLSKDWEDFDKQIGNALELRNLSRRQLELYQMKGYVQFYLFNMRLVDMLRMIISQRKLILQMVRKTRLTSVLQFLLENSKLWFTKHIV